MNIEKLREYFSMGKQILMQHGVKVVLYPLGDKQYNYNDGVLTINNDLEPKVMTDIVTYFATKVVHMSMQPSEPKPKKKEAKKDMSGKPVMWFHSKLLNQKLYVRAVSQEQAVVLLRRRLIGKLGKFDPELTVDNASNVIVIEQ